MKFKGRFALILFSMLFIALVSGIFCFYFMQFNIFSSVLITLGVSLIVGIIFYFLLKSKKELETELSIPVIGYIEKIKNGKKKKKEKIDLSDKVINNISSNSSIVEGYQRLWERIEKITNDYVEFFKGIAAERNTEVVVVDPSKVSEDYLRQFEYMLFPENVALAMGVAQVLGIDEKIALRGMLNAHPDPGALTILPIGDNLQPSYFVNGFAANDATSTLNIWKRVEQLGYPTDDAVVIMNCRPDRVDRTMQFAYDVLPYIPADKVIVIGENTAPIKKSFDEGNIPAKEFYDFEGKELEDVMKVLSTVLKNRVIYGVGNIHGAAEPLIDKLEEYKIKKLVS